MTQALCPTPSALELVPYPGEGSDSRVIWDMWRDAIEHYLDLPVTRQSIEREFQELVETWRNERGPTSSVTELAIHPAYQRIVAMGQKIIPYLLWELARRPDHWFWALNAITGADPVKPEHRGKVSKMAEDWIQWGREQGIHWPQRG